MKRTLLPLLVLAAALSARAASQLRDIPLTNAVYTAQEVDALVAASAPADYATVSNCAMSAVQVEVDPAFATWARTNEVSFRIDLLSDGFNVLDSWLYRLETRIASTGPAATNYTDAAIAAIQIPDTSLEPATNYTDEAISAALHPLAGVSFDFATNEGLYLSVSNILAFLGGSVTNFPSIQ